MNKEQMEWLVANLDGVAKNLADASTEFADMKPDDDGYDKQARVIDSLAKDYQLLVKQYYDILNPETDLRTNRKWHEKLDWTRLITTMAIITASIGQSFAIYKWQKDGYLIGRDAAKIQMPRP